MSSSGGVGHESDETTSYVLQPPRPPQPEPGVGRLIAGRYRLLAKLGHGGMGTVWRAKDETVDREVAVKEPRVPDHLPEREQGNAFERMRREARAAARLDHPSVVNVHDVAVVDGRPWIVMELVQGRSLGDALQEGTLGAREAARIGLEVLGALEAAHAAGILHRDVKPDNVLLGRYDRVVLTDFGIAQIEGETNLTDTGGFVGSPEFIAPERVLGQRPGPASDLWSLGVVLYAATEGVSPFRRSNTPATLQSVLNATPAPPAAAHGPLADAINGLLQKDPARRPNAVQVRALLEATAHPPVPEPTQIVRTVEVPAGGGLRLGRRAWLGLGGAVVAAAVAAYLVIADPFAGPLPQGWTKHDLGAKVGMSVAVPSAFVREKLDPDTSDGTEAAFSDPSGLVRVYVDHDIKAEDKNDEIPDSALSKAFKDWETLSKGDYSSNVAADPMPKGDPHATTYKDRKAAANTFTYVTANSSAERRKRESRIFYYQGSNGDMYRVWVDYPGEGYFTDEGRTIADEVIANWGVDKL
ncbi:serine/threonine-protein kinase [Streptomyces canus]|uniref:serine/threonine-protein kinase n=1 Tax=Streptomyces canus TaxID=58343 RepID=UPI0033A81FF7